MGSGDRPRERPGDHAGAAAALALHGALRPIGTRISPDRLLRAWRAALATEEAQRTPFLWLPVAFGLGVILYFAAPAEPEWPIAALFGLIAAALARAARERPLVARTSAGVAALLAGLAAGGYRAAAVGVSPLAYPAVVTVSGPVLEVEPRPGSQRFVVRVTAAEGAALPIGGRVRLSVRGGAPLVAGTTIRARARMLPPPDAAMPGGYDFAREAFFQRIAAVGTVLGAVRIDAETPQLPLFERMAARIDVWRNQLTARIIAAAGPQTGPLAAALITGKRGLILERDNDDLRAAGLYHIVSISGLHMVIAAGVFFQLARWCLVLMPGVGARWPIKKIAAGIGMGGAIAYCLFAGAEVATVRSLIMTLVMLGAILVDREALALRNLAISALIVMAREPEAVLGPSFQMSYAAVAALIAAHAWWRGRAGPRRPLMLSWPYRLPVALALALAAIAATTLVATLATAPFAAYHFHRANPIGLIGNTLAIPLISLVVMPSAVVGTLLAPLGWDAPVWSLMGAATKVVMVIAARVATLDFATIAVPWFPPQALLWLVLALVLVTLLASALRLIAIAPLILGLVMVVSTEPPLLAIAPDGRTALARTEHGLAFLGAAPPRFALQQWLPAFGDLRLPTDSSLRRAARCDPSGCTARLAGGAVVALVLSDEAFAEDCLRAELVITPLRAPDYCRARTRVHDRKDIVRRGATLVFADARGAFAVLSAQDEGGSARPWRRERAPRRSTPIQAESIDREDLDTPDTKPLSKADQTALPMPEADEDGIQ